MSDIPRNVFLSMAAVLAACLVTALPVDSAQVDAKQAICGARTFSLYPATSAARPDIPSPCRTEAGLDVLTARTEQNDYTLVPVTITPGIAVRPWEAPLEIDDEDFPALASTGLHSSSVLDATRSITGRSVEEISELGRPGRLSGSGFMAEDEDVISVMKGDNRLVARLGLTHTELARPLLHVCNLIRALYQESGARHTNDISYRGKRLILEVEFSRGGQKSIFEDGLEGAWTIRIRRDLEEKEQAFLDRAYGHLNSDRRDALVKRLTEMLTGEMQPFYIYRYGFYEGHTIWRTDPIAIAFMFGIRSIEQIEDAFSGELDRVMVQHFVRDQP